MITEKSTFTCMLELSYVRYPVEFCSVIRFADDKVLSISYILKYIPYHMAC